MAMLPGSLRRVALFTAVVLALMAAGETVGAQGEPDVEVSTATVDPAPTKPADVVPQPPEDIPGAKAYAVLDRSCSGCHQVGRLKVPEPLGRLGNILALDVIATDPSLVRPGLPDASRLYDVILSRHAPVVIPARTGERDKSEKSEKSEKAEKSEKSEKSEKAEREKDDGKEPADPPSWPGPAAALTVRDWIERLPAVPATCPGRSLITPEETAGVIARAISEATADQQSMLRFVSLVPEVNRCRTEADLESARQAVVRLINSLSWAERISVPRRIGRDGSVLVIDLKEIGWVGAHWERLAASYPLAAAVDAPLADEITKLLGTSRAVVRADWLAVAATNARLYFDLIGLPARLADLEQILNVNSHRLVIRRAGVRIGMEQSQITAGARVLERLPTRSSALWRSYDLAPAGKSGETLSALPVGPEAVEGVERVFKPAAIRTLHTSPNGLPMLGLFDPQGSRIDRVPQVVDRYGLAPTASMLPCLSCHLTGVRAATDSLRALAQKDQTPKAIREAILALHPEQASIDTLVDEDQRAVAKALTAAAVEAGRTIGGLEPLAALAYGYTIGGDLDRLAAEAGRTRAELEARVQGLAGESRELITIGHYGLLERADLNRLLNQLAVTPAAAGPPPSDSAPESPPDEERGQPRLAVWASARTFTSGDLATFSVRATADCFLTVIGIDSRKIATVLFPNDFEPNNQIVAGKAITIPSDKAGYQFRLKGTGREQVVALCSSQARSFAGIEHDFERQRFTVLGNWDVFLAEQLAAGAKVEQPAEARARQKKEKDKDKEKNDKPAPLSLFSQHARAALAYEIK